MYLQEAIDLFVAEVARTPFIKPFIIFLYVPVFLLEEFANRPVD